MNADQGRSFAAYMCSTAGRDLAMTVSASCGWESHDVFPGGLAAIARMAETGPLADLMLVELGSIPIETAGEYIEELTGLGSRVIVVGDSSDLETLRIMRRYGADDYFAHPVLPEDVIQLLQRQDMVAASPPAPGGRLIGVMSTSGGAGSSLLAQNLATTIGRGGSHRVALIDLDLFFGPQAIDLDRNFTNGMLEALAAPDRIDETFLEASMEKIAESVWLYSTQVHLDQDVSQYGASIPSFLRQISKAFDFVIVDIPRHWMAEDTKRFAAFEELIAVMSPGFSAISAFSRVKAQLETHAPDIAVRPVLSDLRQDARLGRRDLAKAMDLEFEHVLPRCDTLVSKSQMCGRPIVSIRPRSRYAKAVHLLWRAITEARQQESRAQRAAVQ